MRWWHIILGVEELAKWYTLSLSVGVGGPPLVQSVNSSPIAGGYRESNPHIISSSDTSSTRGKRKKNSATFKMVVDAILERSDRLVAGLKEIDDTTKDMRKHELDLDMKIHEEIMLYKLERDKQVLENARLALQNQGAVVAAISNLADTIRASKSTSTTIPHSATTSEHYGTAGPDTPIRTRTRRSRPHPGACEPSVE